MRALFLGALALKIAFLSLVTMSFASAKQTEPKFYVLDGSQLREVNKRDAMRLLLMDSSADVLKCSLQEISEKATMRNKKD